MYKNSFRQFATLTILAGGLFLCSACAQTVQFPVSPVVPAAQVSAKLKRDKNGNTRVMMAVKHLAQPHTLHPPRTVYVVWLQTADGRAANLGRLAIDDDLDGKLETVTPYKEFRLFVTAEDNAAVWTPSSQAVLSTDMLQAK